MSGEIVSRVFRAIEAEPPKGITKADLLVLLVLGDCAHKDGGGAWLGVPKIAKRSLTSRRGAQNSLRKLEAANLIEATVRPGLTTRYRVLMPSIDAPTPVAECAPTSSNGRAPTQSTRRKRGNKRDAREARRARTGAALDALISQTPGAQSATRVGAQPTTNGGAASYANPGSLLRPNSQDQSDNQLPPLPPKGGRRRDRDHYEEQLQRWIGENFPQLAAGQHGYVRAAIGEGHRTLDAISAYVDRYTTTTEAAA